MCSYTCAHGAHTDLIESPLLTTAVAPVCQKTQEFLVHKVHGCGAVGEATVDQEQMRVAVGDVVCNDTVVGHEVEHVVESMDGVEVEDISDEMERWERVENEDAEDLVPEMEHVVESVDGVEVEDISDEMGRWERVENEDAEDLVPEMNDASEVKAQDIEVPEAKHGTGVVHEVDEGRVGSQVDGDAEEMNEGASKCGCARLKHAVAEELASKMFQATRQSPMGQVPLSQLVQKRGVYNIRKAPASVLKSMLSQVHCRAESVQFSLNGQNSMQVRTKLRKQLASELAKGTHGLAFGALHGVDDRPRADEIEKMVASFPGIDRVDWDAAPVPSGLDVGLWQAWHARHCDACTELEIDRDCYFRLVHHFLRTGFEPTEREECDVSTAVPPCRAYVDLWREEETGCKTAFDKWRTGCEGLMSPVTDVRPPLFFPLLPVVREKDRWLFVNEQVMYKIRLCMDLKSGGLNDMYEDWLFRYLGIDNVAAKVQQGDWLAAIDISRFYLRLPAGRRLRSRLWFQDPSSYARNSHDNQRRATRKLRFRQLQAVAFGLKPAPAWASVVSAELARILESFGVSVAGVYIDDLLIRARSKEELERMIKICETVCAALGLDLNDKTVGPCAPSEGIKYLGLIIRTDNCSFSACPKQCAYAADKISAFLKRGSITLKELESVAGTLTWISYAMISGRPRRNELYRAISKLKKSGAKSVSMRGGLRRQLSWWLHKLQGSAETSSFFWNKQPDTPAMVSDASGEDGWGVCTQGYHIVGHWPEHWKQSKGPGVPSMLVKEMVPPVIAILLFAAHMRGKVFCAGLDNAGVAFVVNSLSSGCSQALQLLRPLADVLATNHVSLLAGHAHRVHNKHTDALSHALNGLLWSQVAESAPVSRKNRDELHFAVLDIHRKQCMLATISIARCIDPSVSDAGR